MTPPLIAVITTGGTIASQRNADGSSTPSLDGQALLARLGCLPPVRLRVVDLFARDSSTLTLGDMQAISDAPPPGGQSGGECLPFRSCVSGVGGVVGVDIGSYSALRNLVSHILPP